MSDFDFAASEQSAPRLLQIRIGQCLPPADYQEKVGLVPAKVCFNYCTRHEEILEDLSKNSYYHI